MRVMPLLLSALLSIFVLDGAGCATSGAVDPLQGVKSVQYQSILGGGLGFDSSIALELFAGDAERAQAFLERLSTDVQSEFSAVGIDVLTSAREPIKRKLASSAWVTASFFGRSQRIESCADCYVFLVRLDVDREIESSGHGEPHEGREAQAVWSRSIVGACRNEELERELARAIRLMLGEIKRLHSHH